MRTAQVFIIIVAGLYLCVGFALMLYIDISLISAPRAFTRRELGQQFITAVPFQIVAWPLIIGGKYAPRLITLFQRPQEAHVISISPPQ